MEYFGAEFGTTLGLFTEENTSSYSVMGGIEDRGQSARLIMR